MSPFFAAFKKQFFYYKSLTDKSLEQLSNEQILHRTDESTNSIAIILNHLAGNMLSRWTDFRTEDGEKEWRNRDQEFEENFGTIEDLKAKWNRAWEVVENELSQISEENLNDIVYIRNGGHTILEALFRQSNHLAYHTGQIVHQAKLLQKENFKTLSIAKGKSNDFNKVTFGKGKSKRHFTDDLNQ